MKRFALLIAALSAAFALSAQEYKYVEATDLTIVGKVFPDTPDPYKRMDFSKYGGWTENSAKLLSSSSGIICSFRTDASTISMRTLTENEGGSTRGERGYDLYIKKDGSWLWAGSAYIPRGNDGYKTCTLAEGMAPGMKECIVYFSNFSVIKSAQVGVPAGNLLEPGDKPFKYDIVLYGSSFTHGHGSARCANTIPGFLSRMTGFQFNSLGVAGDCKMQPEYLRALKDAHADAFFFDTFSNPGPREIRTRTFGFIEEIQATHPGVPLIFIRTIYRENRNFNIRRDAIEKAKIATADSVMAVAVKRYKDVYYIKSSDASTPDHETSLDGTHPSDIGYYLWAQSIRKPLVRILRKYGIR